MVGDGYDPFAEAHWFWGLQTRYCEPTAWVPYRVHQMKHYCMMKKILLMEHTGEDRDV